MSNPRDTYRRSTGCGFSGRQLSHPGQFLPQKLIDQFGYRSPLLVRDLIQNFADIELQTHELNVHEMIPLSLSGSSWRLLPPLVLFIMAR